MLSLMQMSSEMIKQFLNAELINMSLFIFLHLYLCAGDFYPILTYPGIFESEYLTTLIVFL